MTHCIMFNYIIIVLSFLSVVPYLIDLLNLSKQTEFEDFLCTKSTMITVTWRPWIYINTLNRYSTFWVIKYEVSSVSPSGPSIVCAYRKHSIEQAGSNASDFIYCKLLSENLFRLVSSMLQRPTSSRLLIQKQSPKGVL